ncbi:MAG: hypothetical protein AAGB04_30685 [Pseudomonadota bacterium]
MQRHSADDGRGVMQSSKGPPPVRLWLLSGIVLLLTVAVYGFGVSGPLIFDDVPNLTENPYLRFDPTIADAWRIAVQSSDSSLLGRPIAMLTFAVQAAGNSELTPLKLKVGNVVIHLATAAVLYHLSVLLLGAPALRQHGWSTRQRSMIALLAAAIWLCHPLHVSTVLYTVQRMALLSALFTLGGLYVFVRCRLRCAQTPIPGGEVVAASLWIVLLGLLATLSKENGVLLPCLILTVEVFLFRGQWAGSHQRAVLKLAWLGLAAYFLALALAPWLLSDWFARHYWGREFSLQERLLTQARILWQYLSWLALPDVTSMGLHHDDIGRSKGILDPLTTLFSLAAWLALVFTAVVWGNRLPLIGFAVVFFLVGHSLESTVLPLEMVYEHRNYLPSVAICLLMAAALYRLCSRFKGLSFNPVALLVVVLLLGLLAFRSSLWSEEASLARSNVVNHPASARANFFYANALMRSLLSADMLSLDEQTRRAYAITARDYFLRSQALAPDSFSSIVKLHQLESIYFPSLPDRRDWLGELEHRSAHRRLSSSDFTALEGLRDFVVRPGATLAELQGAQLVFETLSERFPKERRFYVARHQIEPHVAAAQGSKDLDSVALLERAREVAPENVGIYPFLVQHYGTNRLGETFGSVGDWLKHDDQRRDLLVMRRIFAP